MNGHQVLYVIPSLDRLKSTSTRRVQIPELDLMIRFETPGMLRDLQPVRGLILCDVIGSAYLDVATYAGVRTRLRHDAHDCPARHVDYSRYVWTPRERT